MKVVIVAKTRKGQGADVEALTFEGRSLRLIAADQEEQDRFNMEYEVGDVWEVDTRPGPDPVPPHTENVVVHDKRRLPPIDDVAAFIEYQASPAEGGPEALYDGLAQATGAGALYVAERTGVPDYSTTFWRPDKPLTRDDDGKRIRYRYPTPDGGRTLTFVGFQEPVDELPAGALLRVSLAPWSRPDDRPDGERRCYVQLSGWFLPGDQRIETGDWRPETEDAQSEIPTLQSQISNLQSPKTALKRIFGYDSFWPLQEEIIANVLAKQDALAVMPTGSGKSLCYQLPALFFSGLTVVVSPLISLMEDQVMQLRELGIPTVALNSSLDYGQYRHNVEQIRAGNVKLLYAAPETLLRPETLLLLEECRVDCLTIDEAHCISEWGHDFRPEYRRLTDVRDRLPEAVCLAVTATATGRVRDDVKTTLGIPDAQTFIASFDRENLFLAVAPKTNGLAQTLAFVETHRDEAGIIYCATRKQVDTLAAQLAAGTDGRTVLPYHAGLDARTRRRHQRRFTHEEAVIVVATIAFGMGIDKPNVRFVLHYDLPKNLESYYQQIGRSGRDGLRADCLLLFSYSDVQTINYFINQKEQSQQIGANMRLEAMLSFAETNVCRRKPLLSYFGETYDADDCGMCDNCEQEDEDLADLTIPAQKFLSCVKRTGEIFGINHIIRVLRGSRAKSVLSRNHHNLSTYDIGNEFSKKEWKTLARQFIQQGLMTRDPQYGSLKLTEKAYQVFKGEQVWGTLPEPDRPAVTSAEEARDQALFRLLRDKRTELATAANVPPYVIFSDRSLAEMATYFPHTKESFAAIYGVGDAKLEKYADVFLPIIRAYCEEEGIGEKRKPATVPTTSSGTSGSSRRQEVAALYNDGHTVPEIAQVYDVKDKTVIRHLWRTVRDGGTLRPGDGDLRALSQLPPAEQERVLVTFADLGVEFLRPVYDALDETISYDELHILRLVVATRPGKGAQP